MLHDVGLHVDTMHNSMARDAKVGVDALDHMVRQFSTLSTAFRQPFAVRSNILDISAIKML